ncbi:MAG: 2-phospho-L-lactate guanylyltransferase [Proteobacteria bacterium]|nr:2-phospho-L-lactate guanylyltransferase [Pseudomonadota bacterium]
MTSADIWAVVPIKPFAAAKSRLAGILTPPQRAQFARVMAEDVLGVLSASRHCLAGILVVTADAEAVSLAQRYGALVQRESAPLGINHALALAGRWLVGGGSGMIIVPTDLPHISTKAVEELARILATPRAAAIVPATNDGGTNVLALRPAEILPPSFGPHSFERHRKAARAAGVRPRVLPWVDLGHDIDRPGDLATFLSFQTTTRTDAFLASLGLAKRLTESHTSDTPMLRAQS